MLSIGFPFPHEYFGDTSRSTDMRCFHAPMVPSLQQQACCGPASELFRTSTTVAPDAGCACSWEKLKMLLAREKVPIAAPLVSLIDEPWFPPRFSRGGQRQRHRQRNRACKKTVAATASPCVCTASQYLGALSRFMTDCTEARHRLITAEGGRPRQRRPVSTRCTRRAAPLQNQVDRFADASSFLSARVQELNISTHGARYQRLEKRPSEQDKQSLRRIVDPRSFSIFNVGDMAPLHPHALSAGSCKCCRKAT